MSHFIDEYQYLLQLFSSHEVTFLWLLTSLGKYSFIIFSALNADSLFLKECFSANLFMNGRTSYPSFLLRNVLSGLPVFLGSSSPIAVQLYGNDSNLLIVFYVQIMPDDFVMQLHRF